MNTVISFYKGIILATLLTLTFPAAATGPAQSLASISEQVENFLLTPYKEQEQAVEVQVGSLDPRLRLAPCGTELEVFQPTGARPLGNTSVGVRCPAPRPWTIYLSATVRVFDQVQVASRPLPRGTILSAADLRSERQDLTTLSGGYETSSARVVGKQLQRPLRAGEVIPSRALSSALVIKRGEQVSILARQGGMEVASSGIALHNAAMGERLQVRNRSSQKLIEGTVIAAHKIEIGL
jgi:flagella basal body P-ring formation protein FlgA